MEVPVHSLEVDAEFPDRCSFESSDAAQVAVMYMTATEASPAAEATRFTEPWRTVHAFDGDRVPRVIDCFARLSPPSSYPICFWTIALREPRERQPRGRRHPPASVRPGRECVQ